MPEPATTLRDRARACIEAATLATGVGAFVWACAPIALEVLGVGHGYTPHTELMPLVLCFAIVGQMLTTWTVVVERAGAGSDPSGLRAMLASGFVFGGALVVARVLVSRIGGPAAAVAGAALPTAPDPRTIALVASVLAVPVTASAFTRLARFEFGHQMLITALLAHAWLAAVWAQLGAGPIAPVLAPFVLAMLQPAVLALVDAAEERLFREPPARRRPKKPRPRIVPPPKRPPGAAPRKPAPARRHVKSWTEIARDTAGPKVRKIRAIGH